MLNKKQKDEIKEHLDRAQNPLFFFDNDADGLCSFLLLQRYLGEGKGVAIKSFPELTPEYCCKIKELKPDYIFILDKPVISNEFWKEIEPLNIPVVWIDHHGVQGEPPDFVHYYDPTLNDPPSSEPVTALCYDIIQKKEERWLALIGCISDHYLPDFYDEFQKEYPDLCMPTKNPFEVLYRSEMGRITRMLGNGLKDRVTNVVNMLRFLMKAKTPYEILEENSKTYTFHKRSNELDLKYNLLIKKAKSFANEEKILFFKYSGDLSISSELANELSFLFPDKIIVVGYVKGLKINLSLRGDGIKIPFLKVIEGIEDAKGGGHENAVGGQILAEEWDKFKIKLESIV